MIGRRTGRTKLSGRTTLLSFLWLSLSLWYLPLLGRRAGGYLNILAKKCLNDEWGYCTDEDKGRHECYVVIVNTEESEGKETTVNRWVDTTT